MNSVLKTLFLAAAVSSIAACADMTNVTSSTSSTTDTVTPDVTINNFIDRRFDAIRKDAARGGGENIDALAQLMGTRDNEAFAQWMQANYDELFGGVEQPAELLARIEKLAPADKG